jgi:hypothetical protein
LNIRKINHVAHAAALGEQMSAAVAHLFVAEATTSMAQTSAIMGRNRGEEHACAAPFVTDKGRINFAAIARRRVSFNFFFPDYCTNGAHKERDLDVKGRKEMVEKRSV